MPMRSILNHDLEREPDDVQREADLIVSAVVLGFVAQRVNRSEPCQFDIEGLPPFVPKAVEGVPPTEEQERAQYAAHYGRYLADYQALLNVLSAAAMVLECTDASLSAGLLDGQSPEGWPGALITGAPGGAGLAHSERHEELTSEQAQRIGEIIRREEQLQHGIYQGRGAYTGVVDDRSGGRSYVRATKRVVDTDPARWHPGPGFADNPGTPWGLIGRTMASRPNVQPLADGGMGPLPEGGVQPGLNVGYIHGLCSAAVKCQEWGGDCVPFEVATGRETTKMASCFACTTFLYASGFPPSATHLGRGESWVPPRMIGPGAPYDDADRSGDPAYDEDIVEAARAAWNTHVHQHLVLGAGLLQRGVDARGAELVDPAHANDLALLRERLKDPASNTAEGIASTGANLFLDALTMHESDWKRLGKVLAPALARVEAQVHDLTAP